MRKRIIAIGFIVALAVSAVLPATALAGGPAGPHPADKVTICHASEDEGPQTITVGEKAAANHLAKHLGDVADACFVSE